MDLLFLKALKGKWEKAMLDQDWMKLIVEAKKLGLTLEEVRDFFKKNLDSKKMQKTG